jgi:hypothetical protein
MRMLSSLSGWPPQGGAGPFDPRKAAFASSPELVTVRSVDRIVGTRVDITCVFDNNIVTFRFFAADQAMADNVADVLTRNAGRSLRDVGKLSVSDDV